MSKLGSIIRHEYLTIVKQPSFWIVMLAIPLLIATVFALVYLGSKASEDRIQEIAGGLKNVAIVDASGLINKDVIESAELTLSPVDQLDALKEQVRTNQKDALIAYPEDLTSERKYNIYLSTNDFTKNNSVSSLANNLLRTSLFMPLGSADIIALAQNGAESTITTYENGVETGGFSDFIAPGIFLVLFYIVFAFSVGHMLTSVSEEKENRSMEMVLTYVKPRELIVGKLLGVSLVTLTQIAFFTLLAIGAYVGLQQSGTGVSLPFGIDLAKISFEFWPLFFGFWFLVVGFLSFAGYMTATAAAAPSAKEANNFSAVFFIGALIPFYFIMLIATDPHNPVVQFITYFPLTSPVVALIRNTVGNMELLESWLALGVMTIFMFISIWIAVRAFKLGALEFSQTIKLSNLFKKERN